MAKLAYLWTTLFYIAAATVMLKAAKPSTFIVTWCKATTYPNICMQTLSTFQSKIQESPRQLTQTALAVSLSTANSAKTFVANLAKQKGLKHREYEALHDCMDEMSDTVDRLSKSFEEMKSVGKSKGVSKDDFGFHMSNVETWVSAALTDENTCADGFAGKALDGKVKAAIKSRCTRVAQVTSNALALVNRYAARH